MTKKYITAVFEYDDGATLPSKLTDAFKSDGNLFEDAKITALSLDDEISRVEKLESDIETLETQRLLSMAQSSGPGVVRKIGAKEMLAGSGFEVDTDSKQ